MEQKSKDLQEMRLLTPNEVQKILGISQWSFDQLVRRKELHAVRVGRRRYITRHYLDKYFNNLNNEESDVYGIKK